MKNVKARVRKILREINLDAKATEYFADMVDYCIKKKISEVDVNLNGVLLPMIAEKHDVVSVCAVKSYLLKALKDSYKETDAVHYHNVLNYPKKISPKKLVIILILKLKKEEDEKVVVKRKKA